MDLEEEMLFLMKLATGWEIPLQDNKLLCVNPVWPHQLCSIQTATEWFSTNGPGQHCTDNTRNEKRTKKGTVFLWNVCCSSTDCMCVQCCFRELGFWCWCIYFLSSFCNFSQDLAMVCQCTFLPTVVVAFGLKPRDKERSKENEDIKVIGWGTH